MTMRRARRRASASISAHGTGEIAQRRQTLGESVGIAIKPQRRFDGREADLVDAQRAFHRVAVDLRDGGALADDEPGLRPAQQLVAGKRHKIGAVFYRFGDGRLVREAPARQIDQRAGAEIVRQQLRPFVRQRREVARRHLGGESLDAIIRGMDLQHQAGLGADGGGIVLEVRAVGGADLDQPRAGAHHDVGHAERAADFDQLAARHDRVAVLGEAVEHQQHRRRVVVDDGRVLGARQFAQQGAHMVVAFAASAIHEIVFERDRAAHRPRRRFHCRLGQARRGRDWCAAPCR